MRRALVLVLVLAACTAERSAGGTEVGASTAPPSTTPSPLVDPRDIVSGGVPKDGIPSIDDPVFVTPSTVRLADREPVLSVALGDEAKAYPLRILIWHEIVNDEIGGEPVAVTYCPLCNSALVFRATIEDGRVLEFGTTGTLYLSNLVMYDRQTDSSWAQLFGKAIAGPLTGTTLARLPSRIESWGAWRRANPDGLVLSEDTGFARSYGQNPYEGYEGSEAPFLFEGEADDRLPAFEHVLGFADGADVVAVPFSALRDRAVAGRAAISARVGGAPVVVLWSEGTATALDSGLIETGDDVGAAVAFVPRAGGRTLTLVATDDGFTDQETGSTWNEAGEATGGPLAGERLEPALAVESLWFSWAAFYPQTRIVGGAA
jgi:hypothetical protein